MLNPFVPSEVEGRSLASVPRASTSLGTNEFGFDPFSP
jgi:hypothetical protein